MFWLTVRGRLFGFGEACVNWKELLDIAYTQRSADTIRYSHQAQHVAGILVRNIAVHQASDAGGINVGYFGKIDDKARRVIGPHQVLKFEEVRERQRSYELKDTMT